MIKTIFTFLTSILLLNFAYAQQLKEVKYKDGSQQLKGLVTDNIGQNRPAVLILPAWYGIDNEAKQAALDLQKEGYVAFIADIYGEGNIPTNMDEAGKIATHYKTDYKAYQHRISLALETLKKQGVDLNKIAVIGYCFGGTGALEVARAKFPVLGVVAIHGGLGKASDRKNGTFNTKVLVEFPVNDQTVSKEEVDLLLEELKQGTPDWQFITYANTGHTFTNPESAEYNAVMANRAWKHTLLFLKEILN